MTEADQRSSGLSFDSSQMKLLACALMVVDHIGIIFFPDVTVLRMIGRTVFPLFAYLIAEGFRHTRDVTGYLGRLSLFALASQAVYHFAFRYPFPQGNVLFTLAVGLYGLYVYEKTKSVWSVAFLGLACEVGHTSYGMPGVLLMLAIHINFDDLKKMALWVFPVLVLISIRGILWSWATNPAYELDWAGIWTHSKASVVEPFGVAFLFFVARYNHQLGKHKMKYFFYLFYPVHLGLLGLLRMALGK